MKFERTRVMNFEGAFHGMRNPLESWNRSDSFFGLVRTEYSEEDWNIVDYWMRKKYSIPEDELPYDIMTKEWEEMDKWILENGTLQVDDPNYPKVAEVAFIGPNDMDLAQRLIRAGSEHRKFMRQIFVSVDITAPLYIWKEIDTYKVGTTANSTSTMHKLALTPIDLWTRFEMDDFSTNLTIPNIKSLRAGEEAEDENFGVYVAYFLDALEELRKKYLETKDIRYWKELIRWLPESWLQTRTITMTYENLLSICNQRRNHKLNEWSGIHTPVDESFIQWARTLPYSSHLIFIDELEE